MTPWVANGALSRLAGKRYRVGGLGRRGLRVKESAEGCVAAGAGGEGPEHRRARGGSRGERRGLALRRPGRGEHEVAQLPVAKLELDVRLPGRAASRAG